MKTSNKILLGMLLVIFTVPFLLATSLKRKIEKGEYTVEKVENDNSGSMRSGSFTTYKVVKVHAPSPGFLTCHLKLSSEMNYSYYNDSNDSMHVSNNNDTLLIEYAGQKVKNRQQQDMDNQHLELTVNLPTLNSLIIDGAVVVIDSVPASSNNFSLTLKNNGELKDGTERSAEAGEKKISAAGSSKEEKPATTIQQDKVEVKVSTNARKLKIIKSAKFEMNNSDVKDLLIYGLLYRI